MKDCPGVGKEHDLFRSGEFLQLVLVSTNTMKENH